MDHPLHDMIEAQLAKARKEGQFDNLPGQGKPLTHIKPGKDATNIRIQSEAGITPKIVALRRAVQASAERLKALTDPAHMQAEMKTNADLQTRLAIELETLRRYD